MYKYSYDFSFRSLIQKYHDIKSYWRHKIYKLNREDILVNDKYCKDNHSCRSCRNLASPIQKPEYLERLNDTQKQKLYDNMANSVRPVNSLPVEQDNDLLLKSINQQRRRLFEHEYKNWN
jgi:hypothetical protein